MSGQQTLHNQEFPSREFSSQGFQRGFRRPGTPGRPLLVMVLLAAILAVTSSSGASAQESNLDVRATASTDTAEQRISDGFMYLTSSDLEFFNDGGTSQVIGVRFPNVNIPMGATITSSSIEFTADGPSSGTLPMTIRAERSAAPLTYSTSTNDLTGRPYTGAAVSWTPSAWNAGASYQTPQLNGILQDIVDSQGSTSAVAFTFEGSGGLRRAFSYQDGAANAPRLQVTYTSTTSAGVVDVRVTSGNDDVEQRVDNGTMSFSSTDLELIQDGTRTQAVGIRFRNLQIPPGATITDAWLEFEVDETSTGSSNLTVRGERSINAQAFTNAAFDLTSRTLTSASAAWSPPGWTSVSSKQQTPSLAAVVQEIVSLGGWQSGNAMVLTVSGTGRRVAESYNGEPQNAPLLHIEFTTDPPPAVGPEVFDINEVFIANPSGQWIELVNPTNSPADVFGLQLCSPQCSSVVNASSIVPAGGRFVVETPQVQLSAPDAVSLLADGNVTDTLSWTQAPATSLARCPDTTGPVQVSGSATKGEANDCSPPPGPDLHYTSPFVINELIQSPGEARVEIINISNQPANPAGLQLCYPDAEDGTCVTLEEDDYEDLEPGQLAWNEMPSAYVSSGGLDLVGWSDGFSSRVVDGYRWTTPAVTSYGRCPDGVGPIDLMVSATPRQPNDCDPDGVVEVRVAIGNDDVEERLSTGAMYRNSSDLELTTDGTRTQLVGIRFQDVTVPVGAVITNAWIEFEVNEVSTGAASLTIHGERVANAFGFSAAIGNVSARTLTNNAVGWSPPGWTVISSKQQTPPLASVVQEIVSLGNWQSGNSIAFVISGSGRRAAESHNGEQANAPLLHIEYMAGSPVTPPPPLPTSGPWPGSGTVANLGQVNGQDWSGASYDQTAGTNGRLWLVNNRTSQIARIDRNGAWNPNPSTWTVPGSPDTEAITVGPVGNDVVYVGVERVNGQSGANNKIIQYNTLTQTAREWPLSELNGVGANQGIEGLTWIPDSDLTALAGYDPAAQSNHQNGLFVLAQESDPTLRFYAVDHGAGSTSATEFTTVESGLPQVMGLEYDASQGVLYASCDNDCGGGNRVAALWLNPDSGNFELLRTYGAPAGHSGYNNEGFALLPLANCNNGSRPVIWTDDNNSGGVGVREVGFTGGC